MFLNNNWILLEFLKTFIKVYVRLVFVNVRQNFIFSGHQVWQVSKNYLQPCGTTHRMMRRYVMFIWNQDVHHPVPVRWNVLFQDDFEDAYSAYHFINKKKHSNVMTNQMLYHNWYFSILFSIVCWLVSEKWSFK